MQSYSRIRKHTIVTVPYYPKGYDNYLSFYLIMQTKYEQQAFNFLGMFPCYSAFFKVRDYLIAYINAEKDAVYEIHRLLSKMLSLSFVSSNIFSIPLRYFSREYTNRE